MTSLNDGLRQRPVSIPRERVPCFVCCEAGHVRGFCLSGADNLINFTRTSSYPLIPHTSDPDDLNVLI